MSVDDSTTQVFKEEAYELLGELEASVLELEENPSDMDLVNQIFRSLHTIKGSGAMFGFDDIADFTHHVETAFDKVRNDELDVTPDLLSIVLKSRDHIYALLEAQDPSSIKDEGTILLDQLSAISDPKKELEESIEISSFQSESELEDNKQEIEIIDANATEVEFSEDQLYFQVKIVPDSSENVSSDELAPLISELGLFGKIHFEFVHEDDSENGTWWEIVLETDQEKDSIEEMFFFTDIPLKVDVVQVDGLFLNRLKSRDVPKGSYLDDFVTPVSKMLANEKNTADSSNILDENDVALNIDENVYEEPKVKKLGEILVERGDIAPDVVNEVLADQKPLGELLQQKGVVSSEKVESALAEQKEARKKVDDRKKSEKANSIRVAADKLDNLVDLVGELVIVQAQISQVVSSRKDPLLTSLSEELERLSDELRDSTLGIRMLPIGSTFSKFRRLVRDLSSDLGKKISLQTKGAETELDKTVIERLSDPLIHLLRNSIDHGIEPPETRSKLGKPEEGVIQLSAEHSGGDVVITIVDDGKGINKDSIKAKAIDNGLISPDTDLVAKDLYNLMFEPGFSTAKSVTSISGRGVGLDVVKRSIDSLRGSIEVNSTEGAGTSFKVRLPLTLAIIDGLQVKVAEDYFVIPLSLVEECVELTRKNVEDSNGQQFVNLRGEIVPYIRLREWFDIEGEAPSIEQIVVTGLEGSRIGIVVDTVIGEHQTVIKSLGRVYKDVEGISGATIKGDGTLALILDIPKLFRIAVSEKNNRF